MSNGVTNLLLNPAFYNWPRGTPMIADSSRVQQAVDGAYTAARWIGVSDAQGGGQVIEPKYKDGLGYGNHAAYEMKWLVGGRKAGIMQIIQHELSAEARMEGLGSDMTLAIDAISSVNVTVKTAVLGWYVADQVNLPPVSPRDPVASWNAAGTDPTLVTGWSYVLPPASFSVNNSSLQRLVNDDDIAGNTYNLAVLVWADTPPANIGDTLTFARASLKPGLANGDFEMLPSVLDDLLCEGYYKTTYDPRDYPGRATAVNAVVRHATGSDIPVWIDTPSKGFWFKTPKPWVFDPNVEGSSGQHHIRNVTQNTSVAVTYDAIGLSGFAIKPTSAGGWGAGDKLMFHYSLYRELA